MIPELFYQLQVFHTHFLSYSLFFKNHATPLLLKLSKVLEKRSLIMDYFDNHSAIKSKGEFLGKRGGIDLLLTVVNPELCLLEDLSKEDIPGFILKSTIVIKMKYLPPKITSSVLVQALEIYKCRFESQVISGSKFELFNGLLGFYKYCCFGTL